MIILCIKISKSKYQNYCHLLLIIVTIGFISYRSFSSGIHIQIKVANAALDDLTLTYIVYVSRLMVMVIIW